MTTSPDADLAATLDNGTYWAAQAVNSVAEPPIQLFDVAGGTVWEAPTGPYIVIRHNGGRVLDATNTCVIDVSNITVRIIGGTLQKMYDLRQTVLKLIAKHHPEMSVSGYNRVHEAPSSFVTDITVAATEVLAVA